MKTLFVLALISTGLCLSGCTKRALDFVEVKKKYTFYYENNRNWVMGKIVERTDDGWFLINYEGKPRWINGNQALMILEAQ